jgi:hypothetical protein
MNSQQVYAVYRPAERLTDVAGAKVNSGLAHDDNGGGASDAARVSRESRSGRYVGLERRRETVELTVSKTCTRERVLMRSQDVVEYREELGIWFLLKLE